MDKIELTTAEREALHALRLHHPHPRVQRKMEALYLKSQGLASAEIRRLCAIAHTTFSRYLHESREGGMEKLTEVPLHRRQSQLADYRTSIAADLRQRPPASVAEAAAHRRRHRRGGPEDQPAGYPHAAHTGIPACIIQCRFWLCSIADDTR